MMSGTASLVLLLAAGCADTEVEHADAAEPVLRDASIARDAGAAGHDGGEATPEDAEIEPVESDAGEEALDASMLDASAGELDDSAVGPADGSGELAEDAGMADGSSTPGGGTAGDAGSADGALGAGDGGALDAGGLDAQVGDAGAGPDGGPAPDAGAAGASCDGDDGGISLPPGFCASRFAEGLPSPRHIAITPAGDVFVATAARSGASPSFVALRDANRDGKAELRMDYGSVPGNGIAWHAGYLYFAPNDSVVRDALPVGALTPSAGPELIVGGLPATPDHYAKTVVIPRQGGFMYVNIGSATKSCQQQNRALESPGVDPCPELATRSGIWKFALDQLGQAQADGVHVASGTRNANALALDATDELYAAQNSRDQLNENWPALFTPEDDTRLPAEGIFHVALGDDYGWPYCYFDAQKDGYYLAPEYGGDGSTVGRCADLPRPVATLPAHWAPLGMVFYDATQFPEHYRHGAFIANHGSRFAPDASEPLPGYNVVFIPFTQAAPAGPFERFAEGFAGSARPLPDAAQHRPVGVAVAPDGALFVSDDKGGTIWRVVYRGQ
jgi:glucose/arabinose dehydrogenase